MAFPISIRSAPSTMIVCLLAIRLSGGAQASNPPAQVAAGRYRIAGIIVSRIDSHPLARARVTIRDAKDPNKFAWMITSDDGKFQFNGLPAGKFSLSGAKRRFISADYDQHDQYSTAIVTGAGVDTEHLTWRLAPGAVISGKVLDEAGEPVRHANVLLYYDDHSGGVDQIREIRGAQTDDQGSYELTPLRPGTYFLSASAKPWYALHSRADSQDTEQDQSTAFDRSLDVAYRTTFYADVTDSDSATPIPIRGGDHLQVDIQLAPVPALTVLFHVADNGRHGFSMPQFQQPTFDSSTFVQTEVHGVSNGVMAVTGIPAGRYNVSISNGDRRLQIDGFDISKDRQEIDSSAAEAMASAKISVKVAGEAAPSTLAVGLRQIKKTLRNVQVVDAKGDVEFSQLAAGTYEVVVRGSGTRYSIAHMTAAGAHAAGHTLTIAPGSSANVALSLVNGNVEVEGIVNKSGRPLAGAMVVLVPKNPEDDRDLFRRDQSDLDGTFTLHGVVPGSYTLLAIENGWDVEWS